MKNAVVRRNRRGWRRRTYVWAIASIALVSGLLYWEQAAVLYLISSVVICALLLIVASADLESSDKQLQKQVEVPGGKQ
jgi:hypothetical protein